MLTVAENRIVAARTHRLVLEGGGLPIVAPGQFVQLEVEGFYLRRPISVCDCSEDSITLIYKEVGEGTRSLASLAEGSCADLLLPLGTGYRLPLKPESVLLVGGGLGAAPLHLLCKALKEAGCSMRVVLGFNTAADIVLRDEYKALGVEPEIVTLDGSEGAKGLVTDLLSCCPSMDSSSACKQEGLSQEGSGAKAERFYTCGPLPMMRAVCGMLTIPGQASLEERMGCGAGFCYGCTIHTASGPARVCADGPVFDKEDIIWQ